MILVWGLAADPPTGAVLSHLSRLGRPVFFFDQALVDRPRFDPAPDGEAGGVVHLGDGTLDLREASAAFIRPAGGSGREASVLNEALICWADLAPGLIVNRPAAMTSNNSKPYQAALIRASGFEVPPTLVTNDAGALAEFQARHGALIYKSASGIRSIVARYDRREVAREADLATCPTQFQPWIPGNDVRVHVVGDEVFGCEITSAATDYRYPAIETDEPRIAACGLPPSVAERCHRLAAALGLSLAGIDLRHTPEDEWICLEVNPSPGFTYFEQATGQPIAAAVAALLARGVGRI